MVSTLSSSTEILPGELGLSETGAHVLGFDPSGPWRSDEEKIVKVCAACCKEVALRARVCPHCRKHIPRL